MQGNTAEPITPLPKTATVLIFLALAGVTFTAFVSCGYSISYFGI
jgi:hypothetical protein